MAAEPDKVVVLASQNQHKMAEIAAMLGAVDWQLKLASDYDFTEFPPEDADTFEGNALIKARAVNAAVGAAVLADDSGLEVDALPGELGVRTARYAGDGATDEQNNRKLLAALQGLPPERRTARFVCAFAYIDDDGAEHTVRGTCPGRIADAPAGKAGFGYDPLFLPDAYAGKCTTAQLSAEDKNAISHRGAAVDALKKELGL